MSRIEEIRIILSEFVEYEYGEILKHELNFIAINSYKQKNSDEKYLSFIENNNVSMKKTHPQEQNFPYYCELFSVVSQHVYGDCAKECLDKAIDIENKKMEAK